MALYYGAGLDRPVKAPEDVRGYLPPDKRHHYRDGYSMAEAAKVWVGAQPGLPPGIASVVGAAPLLRAHFEYPTRVWGGGTAMTDVMVFLPSSVIAVEAKVNEPFDLPVMDWIGKEAATNPRSPPHRREVVRRYADAFGVAPEAILPIRYQLLQRTLAAALTARDCGAAACWMIVQDLGYGRSVRHAANRADFDRFVALAGEVPVIAGARVRLAWADEPPPLR